MAAREFCASSPSSLTAQFYITLSRAVTGGKMGRGLTRDDLLDELDAWIDDAKRTARQAEVLCSFAEDRLVSRKAAAGELQSMSERMLARSQAITRLINVFLDSPVTDRRLVEWAKDLVAESKAELEEFRGGSVLSDVQDLDSGSDTFH